MVRIVFLLAVIVGVIEARSSGADSAACSKANMMPLHGSTPQNSISPYGIELSADRYTARGSVTVTLKGADSFKGFLIMALPENDDRAAAVGTFEARSELVQELCRGGATHTSRFSGSQPAKDRVVLTWRAPNSLAGNLKFYVTFVKTQDVYWVKQASMTLWDGVSVKPATSSTTRRPYNSAMRHAGIMFVLRDIVNWLMCVIWH